MRTHMYMFNRTHEDFLMAKNIRMKDVVVKRTNLYNVLCLDCAHGLDQHKKDMIKSTAGICGCCNKLAQPGGLCFYCAVKVQTCTNCCSR